MSETIHCDRCNRDFKSVRAMHIHCGRNHKEDLVCRECGRDYGSKTFAEDPKAFFAFANCTHREGRRE